MGTLLKVLHKLEVDLLPSLTIFKYLIDNRPEYGVTTRCRFTCVLCNGAPSSVVWLRDMEFVCEDLRLSEVFGHRYWFRLIK